MAGFEPHRLDWTSDRIRRFWDFSSTQPGIEDAYFAKAIGKSLISYVERNISIGIAADIGCGRGDLVEVLLQRGHQTFAVDQSPASVEQVQHRFEGRRNFLGAARIEGGIGLSEGSIDTAFMLEVVEHLGDAALSDTLSDIHRVIRPGGHLVITTPNEEDLSLSETMCPDCGSIFHRMQHVRAWSAKSLSDALRGFGFEPVSAEATVLSPYIGAMGLGYRIAYRLIRKRNPHLVYIGRRA